MNFDSSAAFAVAMRFTARVEPGDHDLGSWAKVDGLDVAWVFAEDSEAERADARRLFPGRPKYSRVRLTRAACAGSRKVQEWLREVSLHPAPNVFSIELRDYGDSNVAIMKWDLKEAMPVKWSIASVDAGASTIALETLEIVHAGFLV